MSHVERSIKRLQDMARHSDGTPFHVSFSGGKDSVATLDIVRRSGVAHSAHMVMMAEPPEVLKFVKKYYPDVVIHKPAKSIFQMISTRCCPPMRHMRYCCDPKERVGRGGIVVTGIRWEESNKRKTRRPIEPQQKGNGVFVHPIIDWTTDQVFAYCAERNLALCSLYAEGFTRVGCVLCPMQTDKKKARDIARFPKYAAAYRRAFGKMIETRVERGKPCDRHLRDAETAFLWWTKLNWRQVEMFCDN